MTLQFFAGEFIPAAAPGRDALRELLWSEAAEIPGLDPAMWRVDHLCRIMRHADFNDASSAFGWGIVRSKPSDEGALRIAAFTATNLSSRPDIGLLG